MNSITCSESPTPVDPKDRGGRTPLFTEAGPLAGASLSRDREPSSSQVTQNDIVVLAGERGTWQVVAPVNGTKADIRRREGFDTRVVTAVLRNLTIVRCAGSPGCDY